MLRNVFLLSFLIYAVSAVHLEIREVGSAEDQLVESEPFETDGITPKGEVLCDICKLVIKTVKKKISSKTTPDEIKNMLNKACDKTVVLKNKCKRFVEKHLHGLIDELMSADGPNIICAKMKACKPEPPITEFTVVRDQAYDNL